MKYAMWILLSSFVVLFVMNLRQQHGTGCWIENDFYSYNFSFCLMKSSLELNNYFA